MFTSVDDNPTREMKPGQGQIPLRNGSERRIREVNSPDLSLRGNPSTLDYQNQASSSDWTQTKETPHTSPLPSPEDGGSLQFINLLGTEKHDTQGQNTVRSHARRHAWKNQKQQQDKKQTQSTKNNDGSQSKNKHRKSASHDKTQHPSKSPKSPDHGDRFYDQCSKFREVAELLPQRKAQGHGLFLNLPPELARCAESAIAMISSPPLNHYEVKNGHSDPFDVFPIPLTPRLHHLIHYSRGIHNLAYENPHDSYSFHMGSSPALVYATIAWTTALSSSNQAARNAESDYYLHKSIIAINEELSNLHMDGLSDGTIAAVACLTNMENLNGDKIKARIHMRGLQEMVAMRGGMNALGMNGVLRRLVLWADVFSATRWQSTPQFPLVELPDLLDLAPICYFRAPEVSKPYFSIKNESFVDATKTLSNADLPSLMKDIYELSHFLDHAPQRDPGVLDRASFPDRIYIIEHKLLWLLSQNEGSQPPSSIILPMLHSLLLYIYTNIRLTPVDGQIRLTLIARLQTYLEASDLNALNTNFPHELRWSLFLGGGAASAGTAERAFFVRTLVNAGCRREWGSWENIVIGLKGMESAFVTRCQEFWLEVDEQRDKFDSHRDGIHGPDCLGFETYFADMEDAGRAAL